jgi:Flp pilus assembly protein TadD
VVVGLGRLPSLQAHADGEFDAAIASYRRSIEMGGNRLWALENLASAYYAKGASTEYAVTLAEIQALDPAAAARIQATIGRPSTKEP